MDKECIKKTSCFGIVLVSLYTLLSILSVTYGITIEDSKGRFVFFQLPIMFQMAGIQELGLAEYLKNLSWGEAYLLLGLPTIFFLYITGWLLEMLGKSISKWDGI